MIEFLSRNSVSFSAAFIVSFALTLLFGNLLIPKLKLWQKRGQPIRSDGVEAHVAEKKGTPTLGGLIFIPAILIASILFMDWSSPVAWLPLAAMVAFGAIGLFDDFDKLRKANSYGGQRPIGRLLTEGVVGIVLTFLIESTMPAYVAPLSIVLPFGIIIAAGIFYFVWSYFVIVGTANAANLTDGQDSLLPKVFLTIMLAMTVALIGITRTGFMPNLLFLPDAGALFPVFGATVGGVLGYLWFNAKPASVYMGDTGSLALGGFLGTSALLMKSEIIMAAAGFMMIIILLSSFLQMMYYKFVAPKGRPPFLMAPLHHHYEKKGIPETKITERFFIMSIIFAGIAIALLKL